MREAHRGKPSVTKQNSRINLMNNDDDVIRLARWQETLAKKHRACMDAKGEPEVVSEYLKLLSSARRPAGMVSLMELASPEHCLKVFLEHWCNCDDTWKYNNRLRSLLRKAVGTTSPIPYYRSEQRAFFESLSQVVTIYRGCSRHRVAGISWTTNISIAEQFARGHRQKDVLKPVIATAQVDKNDIYAVFTDRSDSEIVCTPSRMLKIENFTKQGPARTKTNPQTKYLREAGSMATADLPEG
jgi:hypothetical protein